MKHLADTPGLGIAFHAAIADHPPTFLLIKLIFSKFLFTINFVRDGETITFDGFISASGFDCS
jgi:hypothetical protein